ncbi:MAG: hypothetical protein M1482_04730, partial [Chloroflexi bacterium]|nr:hypothetical protein [Chloroflexota bacterium]
YGSFRATGSGEQSLDFRTGECKAFLWIYNCKTGCEYRMEGSIAHMFAGIRASGPELSGWDMYAPALDYVVVSLGQHDDLTVGATVMDDDAYGNDDTMLDARRTFRAGETLPSEVTLDSGDNWVTVQIEEVAGD